MENYVPIQGFARKTTLIGAAMLVGLGAAQAADLTVEAAGIRNQDGALFVVVYDEARAFKADRIDKAFAVASMAATGEDARITLHDVPAGSYAVSLFHDENGNGDFDMRRGVPKEGYGTSNGRDRFDEPDFARAAVAVDGEDRVVRVRVHYLD